MKCLNCGHEFEKIKRNVKIVVGYRCLICNKIYNTYDQAEQCEIKHKNAIVAEEDKPLKLRNEEYMKKKRAEEKCNSVAEKVPKIHPNELQCKEPDNVDCDCELCKQVKEDECKKSALSEMDLCTTCGFVRKDHTEYTRKRNRGEREPYPCKKASYSKSAESETDIMDKDNSDLKRGKDD